MARASLETLVSYLRHIAGALPGPAPTDAELLGRFVRDRDASAFELLVWRHQRMVFAVCRRVLRDRQHAEDAFQATFLTLVRKAGSISKRQALAGWLYQVAYRIACRARADIARHAKREQSGADLADTQDTRAAAADFQPSEIWPLIDSELQRLPAKYRDPVVLCYLEGKTYDQAATQLGCPVGTLSTRLTTARELLRERLTQRGLAISAGALAVHFSTPHVSAASIVLVAETIKVGTTGSAVSANVAALTKGVIQAMFLTKLKIAVGITLAFTVIGAGGVALVPGHGPRAQAQPGGSGGQAPAIQQPTAPQIWRLKSTITAPEAFSVLAVSPNGKIVAAAGRVGQDRTVRLWDVATGKELAALVGTKTDNKLVPENQVATANELAAPAGSPSAKSAKFNRLIPTGGAEKDVVGNPQFVKTTLAFSPDSRVLMAAGELSDTWTWNPFDNAKRKGPFGLVSQWDIEKQKQFDYIIDLDGPILGAQFSEIRQLETVNTKGRAKIWAGPTGELKESRSLAIQDVGAVAFSPDGKQLAVGQSTGGVVLVDAHSGNVVRNLRVDGFFDALVYSADSKLLATTGRRLKIAAVDKADSVATFTLGRQDIMVWDAATGKRLLQMPTNTDEVRVPVHLLTKEAIVLAQHSAPPQQLAFSPDGKLLAAPGQDNTVRLWNVATGKETAVLEGFKGPVVVILFAPDGCTLITGSADRTIRFWTVQTKEPEPTGLQTMVWECKFCRASVAAEKLREWLADKEPRAGAKPFFITFDDRTNTVFVKGLPGKVAMAKVCMTSFDKSGVPALPADRLDTLLRELLQSPRTNEQVIEGLCLATLGRLPTDVETQLMLKQVADKKDRHQAFTNVLQSFVNSQGKRTNEAREKIETADKTFKEVMKEFMADKTTVDFVLTAQTQLMSARMAAANTRNEREAVLEGHVEGTWIVWSIGRAKYEAGKMKISDYAQTGTQLEEARALLAEFRAKD